MMRKLAVTVFATSLALVGCGSSSTSKKDAGPDAQTTADVGGNKDAIVSPDGPTTADTGLGDTNKVADTGADGYVAPADAPKADVPGDTIPGTDGSTPDVAPGDTVVRLDVTAPDTKVIIPDAPVDSAQISGDAALEVGGDAQAD